MRLQDAGNGRVVQGAMAKSLHGCDVARTGPVAGGLPLPELLAILRRRRHVIFAVTTVATMVAVLIGLQVTKTYTATAQVMIEPRESRIVQPDRWVGGYWVAAFAATTFAGINRPGHSGRGRVAPERRNPVATNAGGVALASRTIASHAGSA